MTRGCIGMKIYVFVHLLMYGIEFFHVCVIKNLEFDLFFPCFDSFNSHCNR